jgi:hypothetical protein
VKAVSRLETAGAAVRVVEEQTGVSGLSGAVGGARGAV